jgi:endoglucanase
LDRRQLLFATLMIVPAMLVGTLVLLFADPGGPDADESPGNTPIGLATPSFPTSSPPPTTTTTVAPPPSSPPATAAPAPAPPVKESPFEDGIYGVHPHAGAQAKEWQASRPADAALMKRMAGVPTATWFGDWTPNVRSAAADLVGDADGKRSVIVTYNLPGRDCGGYSGGGAKDENAYRAWIRDLAAGIANRPAAVILEPDALGQLCEDPEARYRMLGDAIEVLEAGTRTDVYLDAGHALWLDVPTAAQRLRAAGVAKARGFSLNVSNFVATTETERYGEELVNALGGDSHYVIDTSRNGNGPGADWCNPPGRALGAEPTADAAGAHADAYLWVKVPGESDGTCGGAPPAGTWMPEYALGLAREAWS